MNVQFTIIVKGTVRLREWCNKVNQELICLVLNRLVNVQLTVKVNGTVRLREWCNKVNQELIYLVFNR